MLFQTKNGLYLIDFPAGAKSSNVQSIAFMGRSAYVAASGTTI